MARRKTSKNMLLVVPDTTASDTGQDLAETSELNDAQDSPAGADCDEIESSDVPSDGSPTRPTNGPGILLGLVIIAIIAVTGFEVMYANRVFPGVSADGVLMGGLTESVTQAKLNDVTSTFATQSIPIAYGNTVIRVPVSQLLAKYDTKQATSLAYSYGRQGSIFRRAHEQLRALFGRDTNFAAYSYDDARLVPFLNQISDDVTTPVIGPSVTITGNTPVADPGHAGHRLDMGRLAALVSDNLAGVTGNVINAPIYDLAPTDSGVSLSDATAEAGQYLAGPVTIIYGSGSQKVLDLPTIASWLVVTQPGLATDVRLPDLYSFYPTTTPVTLSLDNAKVESYINDFTASLNHPATNAVLDMVGGQLTVVTPSVDGSALDADQAKADIRAALTKPASDRTVTLNTKVTPADVRADNLDQLGIKELISEGKTFFPGSPATRLINVRAGAARFNDVLLKPGEIFSFGAILGDVGPAQGYVPELVILGDHEEKQYGGGLCQVSSTAFRAALYAGLPIVERVNHAFAISYYTAPFGVPGVDATIYYPQVDFKFRNDTPGYILIQTKMQGTSLTFDYYGTKTKTGNIRGPYFVTGSSDATQPSHTVFYRDVLDLAGNVTKTDTIDTYYKSSKDFPVTKQFN